ncbi:MAG: PDZ domain-containing protein [Propionibacteriaceae bacterium]|nr:PDZ domain-containing protein [Propionibacteriaceae bacterium]
MTEIYLRYPDVRGQELVFVADDDVWAAPLAGGRAWRLTSDHAPVADPLLSPDGSRLAWTSWRSGSADVYVMVRSSGEVRRLTWWGGRTRLAAWADDEHLLVASAVQEVTHGVHHLHRVGLDGRAERLSWGPAYRASIHSDGRAAHTGSNFRGQAFWKRYRGGTAPKLWIEQAGGVWAEALADQPASKEDPGWFGDRVFFTSDLGAGKRTITDPTAQAQLYSVDASGGDLRQHTHHTQAEGYVRDPRTDGATIVYHAHGRLYSLPDLAGAEPKLIELNLAVSPRPTRQLAPTEDLNLLTTDQANAGSLAIWHGGLYYLTHRQGPVRELWVRDGVRVRLADLLGKTGRACFVDDEGGSDRLMTVALDGATPPQAVEIKLGDVDLGYLLHLKSSPDGKRLALGRHDGAVLLVNLSDGTIQVIDDQQAGESHDFSWSPDSRYLVWSSPVTSTTEDSAWQLRLFDATAMEPTVSALTDGLYRDRSPVFSLDGRYLAWLSDRTFDPAPTDFGFDLALTASTRPWCSTLNATTPPPFGPTADGWAVGDTKDDCDGAKAADAVATPEAGSLRTTAPTTDDQTAASSEPSIDFDITGFDDRAVPLPVASGVYRRLWAVKDGLVWSQAARPETLLDATLAGSEQTNQAAIELFSATRRSVEMIIEAADALLVSPDGEHLLIRDGDGVYVQAPALVSPEDKTGRVPVDLTRLRRRLDLRSDWRQMFDEQGRLMRLCFWREDMDGVDWAGVLDRYRLLVESVATADDWNDLTYECVAELNTSHCYIIPAPRPGTAASPGFIGAAISRVTDGFRIDEILPGVAGDPRAWHPLRRAGVDAAVGDIIVAVDGRPASEAVSLGALLEGTAGRITELRLRRAGQPDRSVAIVPLASENGLYYHDWVIKRAARVEARSGGRLGYIHVPDMSGQGWAQFNRMSDQAAGHEGLIADVRYNGGGFISQLVVERLLRRVNGWNYARHGGPTPYPAQAIRGPVVLVTNENAGSDGDIVTAMAREHGLPVVGTRTWGGIIGIDGRFHLIDDTEVTQPRYTTWLGALGWSVENWGVDPDVEVALTPADWADEDDRQLDVAIDLALAKLDEQPAAAVPAYPPARFGQQR